MRDVTTISAIGVFLAVVVCIPTSAAALDIVRHGKPAATIVIDRGKSPPAERGRKRGVMPSDAKAAAVLVDWVRKMTGAELPIAAEAPADGAPVIYIGAAAVKAGLKLDAIDSPGHEGLRLLCDGKRVLLAGQDDTATLRAVCRLLERWGCRYFIDHPLGEVYPRTKTLTLEQFDHSERPGLLYRSIWGSQWGGNTLWKTWNGAGGPRFATGHAWGQYVPKNLFKEHPEYFHERAGQREASDWYCTSNPGLREVFADAVVARIKAGSQYPSISPPDGRGYCQCDACRAQDDSRRLEPSSGHVSITDRYVDFYQFVARRAAKANPDAVLNFYCYADYTQAPAKKIKLEPNLCAWIAPIRYCRFHAIGHTDCPSRVQLGQVVDEWAECAQKIAYRTYNYNLSETLVPFSLISVWKQDIPYLKQKGCIGINLETLANWQIYGPHIYLSIRLAYDPATPADLVMDDFYAKFYGPRAGPLMKEYWTAIDREFVDLRCHAGSFFALHLVYTPEFLKRCQSLLDRAAAAAKGDEQYAARVQMAADGLRNAAQYIALREAMNRGDFARAKEVYDDLLARNEEHQKSGLGNHYTVNYLKRFLGTYVSAGAAATAAPRKMLQVLPDMWRLAYDPEDQGVEKGFAQPAFDDSAWRSVATFGNSLDAQGLSDRQTILWYRTRFSLPAEAVKKGKKLVLFFTDVDGNASVYVNGKPVGDGKKRQPFEVDITAAAKPGENLVAVRVDHSNITELFLGGIIRPVLVIGE